MYLESRYNLGNIRKSNRFPGRMPKKAVYVILAVILLLGGIIWHEMSGARAATIDLINSTFEDPADVVNWAVYGQTNATVSVASTVYNHTPEGSHSARIETSAPGGASTATKGGIERRFTMPSGTINTVALSVYYRNSSAQNLNLKWEILNNSEEPGTPILTGDISTSAIEKSWTWFNMNQIDPDKKLNSSYTYILRFHVDGETNDEAGSTMSVDIDDVVLKADYVAVPTRINVAASTYSIPNNDITTSTVMATVYDQNNQLLSGENVTFTKDKTWGLFGNSQASQTVETVDGRASVTFKSDTGGVVKITASAGSVNDSADITVLYPGSISLSSSRSSIPNNNTTKAGIIARVLDQFGNPLQNVKVNFDRSPLAGTLLPEYGFDTTNEKGEATTAFSSSVGGEYTITATVNAKSDTPPSGDISKTTKIFVQEPGILELTVDKEVISNDNNSLVTVTAQLKNQAGQFMNGEVIDFVVSPAGETTPTSAVTKSNGIAQVSFNSNVGENYTITGTVHRKTTVTDTATVKVAAPTTLTLQTPVPSKIPSDNKSLATVTATLTDQSGAAIKGERIDFSTDIGEFDGAFTDLATDSNGRVTVRFKSGSAGTATITGSVQRLSGTVKGTTTVIVEDPVPASMLLTSSKTSIPDDNSTTTTVTATVYDQFSHVMSGRNITFSKSPVQGSFTPESGTVTTNGNGKAAIQFRSDRAGTFTITGTCGTVSQNITVNVLARVPNSLTLAASSATVPDDGSTVTTITAQLIDQFGNPFTNQTVHFSKNQSWGTFSASDAVTDSMGKASVTFKSTTSGSVIISAAAGAASDQQEITVQHRLASILTLNASPVIIVPGESSTIVAHLTDQFGMPISNKQIMFTTGLGELSEVTAVTNETGDATVTLSSPSAPEQIGTTIITGKVNGMPMVTGMIAIDLRSSDTTPPTLIKAEATSKQVFYLTFSERIKLKAYPPTGWTLMKYEGESVTSIPINDPIVLSSDNRIVRVTLKDENMATGNQYPDPVRYEIIVGNVTDLAGKDIDPNFNKASFDAFSPHGKYAPFPVASGNSTRICAQCHSPHKAVGEKLLTASTVKKVCFVCHGTTGMSTYRVESEFYRGDAGDYSISMHKALDSDDPGYDTMTCVDCHVAHGIRRENNNDNGIEIGPKLLQARNALGQLFTSEDGNKFCIACHGFGDASSQYGNRLGDYWQTTAGDHNDGMNVVENVYNSAHYDNRFTSLKSNGSFDNTCLSCHEQHGSKNQGLVANNVSVDPEKQTPVDIMLCYKCHAESSNSRSSIDIEAKFNIEGLTASKHNILDPDNVGLACRSCHEPHSVAARSFDESSSTKPSDISDPSNTKNNWNKDSGNMAEFCIKCHNKDSGAALTKTKDATTLIPATISLPELTFANGTGWNKSLFSSSGHYSQGIYCNGCHDPHGSENSNLNLLPEDPVGSPDSNSGACLSCHGGGKTPAGTNVYSGEFDQEYNHPTLRESGKHSNTEDYSNISSGDRHAECADCHDPHTANNSDKLGRTGGVKFSQAPWGSWSSSTVTELKLNPDTNGLQAYLCYKCHSKYSYKGVLHQTPSSAAVGSWQPAFNQTDIAKEFNPDNSSRHVVEGKSEMPSFTVDSTSKYYGNFKTGWSATTSMKCTDCHSSSTGQSQGPHGSANAYILKKPWNQNTGTAEGNENHLCFECHDYSFYAGSDSGSFTERSQFSGNGSYNLHRSHANKGCVTCHGAIPHGWNKKDSDGDGLSLFTNQDPRPYRDGVVISEINSPNTPGNWTKASCTTACHPQPEPDPEPEPEPEP